MAAMLGDHVVQRIDELVAEFTVEHHLPALVLGVFDRGEQQWTKATGSLDQELHGRGRARPS